MARKKPEFERGNCSACGCYIKIPRAAFDYYEVFGDPTAKHFCVSCLFITVKYGKVERPRDDYRPERELEYENA